MLCDRSLSFLHLFCHHSVNRIIDERGNGRRPNLVGTGKWWPSRSDWILVMIRLCVDSGSLYHFIYHWGIGDFRTFVSISVFFSILTQSTDDWFVDTWRNDWRWRDNASKILGRIRQTSGSRLIRKSEFESWPDHFCFKFWRWRRFALSVTDRTSLIGKVQNVWSHRFSKRRRQ